MKCPNCKNEIEFKGGRTNGIPTKPNAKWYQFTNVMYSGTGYEIVPKNPDAKWYQYTKTIVRCSNCATELKVLTNMTSLRYIAGILLIFIPLFDLFFPGISHKHPWLKLLLLVPSTVMLFTAHRKTKYAIEIAVDKLIEMTHCL